MRKLIAVALVVAGMGTLHAATRGDVKVLEASDTIRFVSDKLAREYLLYTLFPYKRSLKTYMDVQLEELPKSFQDIAVATKDERTKGLLSFFTYQKARADEIVRSPSPTKELADEMLEMSRSFVEGSENIARYHTYDFSFEENMFMLTRSMQRHLASLSKYYAAHLLFPDDPDLAKRMEKARRLFDAELKTINEYRYKDEKMTRTRDRLNAIWKSTQPYWEKADDKTAMPMVLSLATDQMIDLLDKLGVYHSKNQ